MSRFSQLSLFGLALLAAACSDTGSLTELPDSPGAPIGGTAAVLACTVDTAQVTALLTEAFSASPDENAALGKWNNIQHQVNDLGDVATGKDKVFDLVDFIYLKLGKSPSTISTTDFASLLNQLFCFVGIDAGITDPGDTWIVHVGDPLVTFVTDDQLSGIQFPSNAVTENTLVTAKQASTTALFTLLDKYPFVYDWSLSPAQTLTAGTEAIVGVCPDVSQFPTDAAEANALLGRLVLGHQHGSDSAGFALLPPVPIPPEMVLSCGTIPDATASASWGSRLIHSLASIVLPREAHASVMRGFVGGVGGSTSEFSSFGTVDPTLRTGGVGGSTSEFLRLAPAVMAGSDTAIDGTVGGTTTSDPLPSVTIRTYQGTVIPGVGVHFTTGPGATATPVGDATVCGSDTATDASGTAAVSCIDFGTTVQYSLAYTRLSAAFTLPPALADTLDDGTPIVSFEPGKLNWLVASHGPSALAFTQPAASQTYTADDSIPVRIEIRSDLGDVVTSAANTITLTLNQNAFGGGATSVTDTAVAGVATFKVKVPKAATGYQFTASASLSDVGTVTATSNSFDVVAGAAARISAVTTTSYGTVGAGGNPVSPDPRVLVTDAEDNVKPGATVYWMPGGATGAEANGSTGTTTTTTAGDGTTSAIWLLGEGDNLLRASLQAAPGGAEVFFAATLASGFSTINSCAPGGAKDDITSYYYVIPGPSKNGGIVHSIGMYLSAAGAVGQIDPDQAFPMTLVATRTYTDATTNAVRTDTYAASALAFLRGDNGSSGAVDRLVTFNFDIPEANVKGGQAPELTVRFQLPAGGYGRKINFNAGECGPGKCRPPQGCTVSEYRLPIGSGGVYRKSVALMVRGR